MKTMKLSLWLTVALLVMGAASAKAQLNPKAGYIITLTNDTIHGTIDYLSGAKNALACKFAAEGQTDYTTYTPEQIKGYRLADNGIFYVARTFPVNGKEKTFFAEYMLEGGMSLYRHEEDHKEYFYLVDAEGRVAEIRQFNTNELSKDEIIDLKKRELHDAFELLKLSDRATESLWNGKQSARTLLRITRDYNDEFCSDTECIAFQYDEKAARSVTARLYAAAGGAMLWTGNDLNLAKIKTLPAAEVRIGAEYVMPRISNHITFESILSLAYGSRSAWAWKRDNSGLILTSNPLRHVHEKAKSLRASVQLGAAYHFLEKKRLNPYVKAGLDLGYAKVENEAMDTDGMLSGVYGGLGLDIALRKHTLRIEAGYRNDFNIFGEEMDLLPQELSLTVGLVF